MSRKYIIQETPIGSSSKQKRLQHTLVMMGGEPKIPEAYHLERASNYGIWAYKMKHMLQQNNLFPCYVTKFVNSMND